MIQLKLRALLLATMLCALCVGQASALEYTMEAPDDYLFGRPTSDDTIYEWEDPNVDRNKNTALIPPGFGTPTSYLPGSGDPLTPNLIPGALDGGGLVSQTGSVNYPVIDTGNGDSSGQDVGYTAVTSDLYYSGGHLGTLKIPAIGLSTKVYEGTDSSTLAKGAGHFPGTSIWDGNCCIAGHNRGVRDDFGDLHTLEPGDTIMPPCMPSAKRKTSMVICKIISATWITMYGWMWLLSVTIMMVRTPTRMRPR